MKPDLDLFDPLDIHDGGAMNTEKNAGVELILKLRRGLTEFVLPLADIECAACLQRMNESAIKKVLHFGKQFRNENLPRMRKVRLEKDWYSGISLLVSRAFISQVGLKHSGSSLKISLKRNLVAPKEPFSTACIATSAIRTRPRACVVFRNFEGVTAKSAYNTTTNLCGARAMELIRQRRQPVVLEDRVP